MFPFLLYLVAAVLTAAHVYVLLSMAVFGAPRHVLELLSLFGSSCLLVSAVISLWRPRVAAKFALLAALSMWCFYAPAIATTIKAGWNNQRAAFRVVALPYLAIISLVLVTIYAVIASARSTTEVGGGTWLFPTQFPRRARLVVTISSAAVVIAIVSGAVFSTHTSRRPSSKILIPDNYVGWVRIEFQVPGSQPVPIDRDRYVFTIPPDGVLKTSSPEKFGYGKDEYFYNSGSHPRSLPSQSAQDRLIWGQINGEDVGPAGPHQYEEFFVGTAQQFKDQAGVKRASAPPETQ
jgi:hypothetical protein